MTTFPDFDPDFASAADWARLYRRLGYQVVPQKDKHPVVVWKEFQNELVSDATFDAWYGSDGRYKALDDMGVICGVASGDLLVIDLDTHKNPKASEWWAGLIAVENNNIELETVEQRTGGGGSQKLFRVPKGWRVPTNKTSIGIDIRGQGGFIVVPPSMHQSGKRYSWLPLCSPWEKAVMMAPQWLLDAVLALCNAYPEAGGSTGPRQRTEQPASDYNAFGKLINGREAEMTRRVWGTIARWRKERTDEPPESEWEARSWPAYEAYERVVATRIPGVSVRDGLEQENPSRGISLWRRKWRHTMKHWNSPRMIEAANSPHPDGDPNTHFDPRDFEQSASFSQADDMYTGKEFELLNPVQIKAMPPPVWLISGCVIAGALGFFFGDRGTYKTFITLDMGLALACGREQWWGRSITNPGGLVLYVSCENNADLQYRIRSWEQKHGQVTDDAHFLLLHEQIRVMQDQEKLIGTIHNTVKRTGKKLVCIFVDTVSRVLPGAKENAQEDMSNFVGVCDAVAKRFGCAVVGVHHESREGNMRGSTVLEGAADFLFHVEQSEEHPLHGTVTADKIKAAEDGWKQTFSVEHVPCGDVGGHTSLVVVGGPVPPSRAGHAHAADSGSKYGATPLDVLERVVDAIGAKWDEGNPLAKNAGGAGMKAQDFICSRFALEYKLVKKLLIDWEAEGVISYEKFDAGTKRFGYRKKKSIRT